MLPKDREAPEHRATFRAAFADEFSAKSWSAPVVVVVALKKQEYLSPELLRFDRFSRCLSLPQLDDVQHGQVFIEISSGVHFDPSVAGNLEETGAIVRRLTYIQRRNLANALRRLCWQEERAATLRDLIELESFGTAERDRPSVSEWLLWRNAVHEAGHAVAGYLESGRTQVPIYCSVVSRPDCLGVVMPSRAESRRSRQGDVTYSDWVQDVRVLLAGRAAEQVLLGADQISGGGSRSDLKQASRLVWGMFARHGMPSSLDDDQGMAANLLVVLGRAVSCEVEFVSTQSRRFLSDQYQHTVAQLREHQEMVLRVATRLMAQDTLLQADLRSLLEGDGNNIPSQPNEAPTGSRSCATATIIA